MERFEKLHPSLPFNLDEAAEEYAPDFSNSIASKAAVDAVRDAFKAGAQWQKQQNDLGVKEVDLENTFIDKACEWIKKNRKNYSSNALGEEYLIDDFKKAMKGK